MVVLLDLRGLRQTVYYQIESMEIGMEAALFGICIYSVVWAGIATFFDIPFLPTWLKWTLATPGILSLLVCGGSAVVSAVLDSVATVRWVGELEDEFYVRGAYLGPVLRAYVILFVAVPGGIGAMVYYGLQWCSESHECISTAAAIVKGLLALGVVVFVVVAEVRGYLSTIAWDLLCGLRGLLDTVCSAAKGVFSATSQLAVWLMGPFLDSMATRRAAQRAAELAAEERAAERAAELIRQEEACKRPRGKPKQQPKTPSIDTAATGDDGGSEVAADEGDDSDEMLLNSAFASQCVGRKEGKAAKAKKDRRPDVPRPATSFRPSCSLQARSQPTRPPRASKVEVVPASGPANNHRATPSRRPSHTEPESARPALSSRLAHSAVESVPHVAGQQANLGSPPPLPPRPAYPPPPPTAATQPKPPAASASPCRSAATQPARQPGSGSVPQGRVRSGPPPLVEPVGVPRTVGGRSVEDRASGSQGGSPTTASVGSLSQHSNDGGGGVNSERLVPQVLHRLPCRRQEVVLLRPLLVARWSKCDGSSSKSSGL
ncbi:unnamed protein product [Vitrella brassicaformis CCMP3155]|uniref:Transmembrane protein n=1 Tax=Vitrella brassicaformis (strain CCMP3155) TaxID=1169540 RepID=A0A0G4F0U8_VITBC|nr:unnamed protein product [Vitrella brassicaformis CCMP3155]|eukprot:CEM04706.1 unnamed protein product [Vitrella brassicaformis CCMP3155]